MSHTKTSEDHEIRGFENRSYFRLLASGIILVFGSSPALAQLKPDQITTKCTNGVCHSAVISHDVMHGPTAQISCMTCHEYVAPEQHLFSLTKPRNELCSDCHTLKHDAFVHSPVVDNNCMGCHDPHGSDQKMMLIADPAQGLCITCHDQDFSEKKYVHGPVAIGACIICHQPHSSPNENLLTKNENLLCLDCHSELAPEGLAARHQHKPLEEGCSTCHDPHASDHQFQLKESPPNLCYTCHEGIKHLLEDSKNVHGPALEEGGCVKCHNPHFTQLPYLQREPQPDLCLECHNKPLKAKDGRELINMEALLEENENHHGPIREGACTTCHQPHAGKIFSLLYQKYPAEFYAEFKTEIYSLCFSCHISDLVQDESGLGLTNFRDGDLNLHWLHVNKKKGRTCRACHEVHASKNPFHIRDAVPFGKGGWMLKINYEQNEDGGTCAPGCHKAKIYDRSRPRPTPEEQAMTIGNGE